MVKLNMRDADTSPMRCAIYTRVSTEDQRDGASLDVQRERCRSWSEAHGLEVVREFSDPGVSGAFFERDGLLAALGAAERGEIDVLVAYNLDRFSRGVWPQLTSAAEGAGLRLVTADGVIDTADDERTLPADMYEAFAKESRRLTTKRSMDSRAQRVREGKWVGGVAPYGHRIERGERGSRLELDENEAAIVRRAFDLMLDDGHTPSNAAARLNAEGFTKRGARWTARNLIQTLSRTTLDGRFVYGKEHRAKTRYDATRYGIKGFEVDVPRVVEHARFVAMQELLATVKWKKQTAHEYPLSGRLESDDGHRYLGRFDTRNLKRRYRCGSRYDYSIPADERCSHAEIDASTIEAAVWWAIEDELKKTDKLYELLDELEALPSDADTAAEAAGRLERRLKQLRAQRVKVEARALREGFSRASVEEALAEIDGDAKVVEAELEQVRAWAASAAKRDERRDALATWARLNEAFDNPDLKLVKRVFDVLDIRVVMTARGRAQITVNLPLEVGLPVIVSSVSSMSAATSTPRGRQRRRARRS